MDSNSSMEYHQDECLIHDVVYGDLLLSDLPSYELHSGNTTNVTEQDGQGLTASILPCNSVQYQAGMVIAKIEDIFESITDCILNEKKELTIPLKSRRSKVAADNYRNTATRPSGRNITFPSKSPQEAWKFSKLQPVPLHQCLSDGRIAALLRILELSHEALVTGIVTTKRDIYYRDPELFVKQAVVDRYVDDLAFTLGIERDALNVVAAAKGLVAGAFSVLRKDGSKVDLSTEPEGVLIPNVKDIQDVEFLDVKWILVIEKEATFRTLATAQYWKESVAGSGIFITAKGYPDIQTRQFLNLLSVINSSIPMFALMDYDPDGLGITSTYKHGSINLAHEPNLTVPDIHWLGIRSVDFMQCSLSAPKSELQNQGDAQGLLKMSARDRRIARKMLERNSVFGEEGMEAEWRREIQVMLILNVKAEIQILGNGERLSRWLDEKLWEAIA